jgi:hypothetical protein
MVSSLSFQVRVVGLSGDSCPATGWSRNAAKEMFKPLLTPLFSESFADQHHCLRLRSEHPLLYGKILHHRKCFNRLYGRRVTIFETLEDDPSFVSLLVALLFEKL